MSKEREELATAIANRLDMIFGKRDLADHLIELGYRKVRVVTTAEELDALPSGSVIRDDDGDAWQRYGTEWCSTDPGMDPFTSEEVAGNFLPATVIHEGTQ